MPPNLIIKWHIDMRRNSLRHVTCGNRHAQLLGSQLEHVARKARWHRVLLAVALEAAEAAVDLRLTRHHVRRVEIACRWQFGAHRILRLVNVYIEVHSVRFRVRGRCPRLLAGRRWEGDKGGRLDGDEDAGQQLFRTRTLIQLAMMCLFVVMFSYCSPNIIAALERRAGKQGINDAKYKTRLSHTIVQSLFNAIT